MKSGLLNQEFAMTATFSHVDDIIFNDITFKNQLTYLGLPQMKAYYDITISFRFKTIEMNGKLLVHTKFLLMYLLYLSLFIIDNV